MLPSEDLPSIFAHAWSLLAHGAAQRKSPLHTPVVASVDAHGMPQARVMVLREADSHKSWLRFHTDARSPKVTQLDGQPVAVLAYDPAENIQLRLTGQARIGRSADVDAIWAAATTFARRCYMAEAAPGTALPGPASGLPAWIEGQQPTEADVTPARPNFAVLWVGVTAIDWLHLANSGHRRAVFRAGDGWAGEWVVP